MGLVTASLTIIGATTSNAPMNISRTLGVAIVTDTWTSQWIYPLAGWFGAILGTFMWLQTIESVMHWNYGYELILYFVYVLLRFVTFGAIDRLLCNKRLWSGKKSKMPVDFERKNDGNNASSKTQETKTEDNDTKTEDNDVVVSPSAVVDTAAI